MQNFRAWLATLVNVASFVDKAETNDGGRELVMRYWAHYLREVESSGGGGKAMAAFMTKRAEAEEAGSIQSLVAKLNVVSTRVISEADIEVTRTRDDDEFLDLMQDEMDRSWFAHALEREALERWGRPIVMGLARGSSNANTDLVTGEITINPDQEPYQGVLSYVWELTNLMNLDRHNALTNNPLRPRKGDSSGAKNGFIMDIIKVEAEAALNRALVTIEGGWTAREIQANPAREKYIKVAKRGDLTRGGKIDAIAELMFNEGKLKRTGQLIREVYAERFLRD